MKPKQTLTQWLTFLEHLHPKGIDLGLERVAAVATKLSLLSLEAKVVTVAGTNGKGSTIAMLETGLSALGLSYGSYTSPHIHHFNERVRLNSLPVNDAQLIENFEVIESARGDISLSYFEYTTLAALLCFQQMQPDVILLEVGLGGRLDAVNIIDADIAIVTSIALDHQDWLGDTLDEIATEKLGIARASRPLLIGELNPCEGLLLGAPKTGADCYFINRDFHVQQTQSDLQLELADGELYHIESPNSLSPESIVVAAQALGLLGCALDTRVLNSMSASQLLGRFDIHTIAGKTLVFDVAHNPAAIARLCERMRSTFTDKIINISIAVMADKNVNEMLTSLGSVVSGQWFLPSLNMPRAMTAYDLSGKLSQQLSVSSNEADILTAINTINSDEVLLICGSFYTVAAGMHSLQSEGLIQ